MFIDTCAFFGMVKNRKRATGAWNMAKARRLRDEKAGIKPKRAPPRPWELKDGEEMGGEFRAGTFRAFEDQKRD